MGQSYRIRTELGINKSINIQLDQEFEFLEILSLTLQQEDVYSKSCAEYGVVVGRVTANNGFGIPNARVSIFIPILPVDESNPLISSIYPYKSPNDKNEDGYRYNLLPYQKSYSTHAATGTLPTRLDVLTGNTAVEIYDKYYKFTAKTNDSGDYMIMGVPQGSYSLVMDVDLSDIGEFSLTPQDLIRMGLATEAQVAGNRFRTSTDLNSLPQIINVVKSMEVSPLWGDPELCTIAINRVDFDLRDDANVDIQPTATFMGSIFSSPDSMRVRKNNRPKDNLGNLCGLVSGPGQILAVRQTIDQDSDGNPVLEQYQLEQAGNIIDGNGVWLTELPMNLDYFITNEFGEKVLSYDPSMGIPTKAKYRFKVKWQQSPTLSEQTKRPYFLVPNVKEYGWLSSNSDPLYGSTTNQKKLASSYYFGLAWSGYTDGFSKTSGNEYYDRINEIINCEDTFYEFGFNRVYTVSQLIDEYKKGGRGRFIGIKEIDSNDCESTTNKFPVNEGFRNFDLLFFLFSFILQIIQLIGIPLIVVARIILFIYAVIISFLCWLANNIYISIAVLSWHPFRDLTNSLGIDCDNGVNTDMTLTMLTYPDCDTCSCKTEVSQPKVNQLNPPTQMANPTGNLTYFSYPSNYNVGFQYLYQNSSVPSNDVAIYTQIASESLSGLDNLTLIGDPTRYKLPISNLLAVTDGSNRASSSKDLPLGERINLFNQRDNFFIGQNRIKVTFEQSSNIGKFHYDNTITILANTNGQTYSPGDLLTFVNPNSSKDPNYLYSASTTNGDIFGLSGTSYSSSAPTTINVSYATSQTTNSAPITYNLSSGSTITNYLYPADVEYYQVVTALTVSQAALLWNTGTTQSFPNILNSPSTYNVWYQSSTGSAPPLTILSATTVNPLEYYNNYTDEVILILQRGVDPYSPKYLNQFGIGKILGYPNEDDIIIQTPTRVNIPIQKLSGSYPISVQSFATQDEIYYQSYFFRPGIVGSTTLGYQYSSFTTNNIGYYGSLDSSNYVSYGAASSIGPASPNKIISLTSNGFYSSSIGSSKYDSSEDVSGLGMMTMTNYSSLGCTTWSFAGGFGSKTITYTNCSGTISNLTTSSGSGTFCALNGSTPYVSFGTAALTNLGSPCSGASGTNWPNGPIPTAYYWTKAFGTAFTMSISNSVKNVMRTDRLPTSDNLDGGSWTTNPSILQQNLQFMVYRIPEQGATLTQAFGSGASQVRPDIEDLPYAGDVLSSFDCPGMVPLDCYNGFGSTFQVTNPCNNPKDAGYNYVKNGCYVLLHEPLKLIKGIVRDTTVIWPEWGYRFRFMYALCRGVLSQSFTNNWINGSLFMFPIQSDVFFDKQNKPKNPQIPEDLVYFDTNSINFYYRSSPYNDISNSFIGRQTNESSATNERNLMFPTTLINLGYKDIFYSEITFDPSTNAYIIPSLESTSYGDTSDLTNLFAVSRMVDSSFLQSIFGFADDSIGLLFSRPNDLGFPLQILDNKARVDGDFVQLCSINSEIGNINFSPEYYATTPTNSPTNVLGTPGNPVMAVWFSSTTQNLQTKDYLTPGRINFRTPNNSANFPFSYGIKSQIVPHYQWELRNNTNNLIFGSQINDWATKQSDIVQNKRYQSLDRTFLGTPNYFRNTYTSTDDLLARGYIFSMDLSGNYIASNSTNGTGNKFIVGAPFHFYFGTVKGETALDQFKRKYSVIE